MNKINIFLICLVPCFILGCTSSNKDGINCYKVNAIDSSFFKEYFLISISDNNLNTRYILSDRKYIVDSPMIPLIVGGTYCFIVHEIDTSISATLMGTLSQNNPDIYVDKKLLWSNGKIVLKVYTSDVIRGKYYVK